MAEKSDKDMPRLATPDMILNADQYRAQQLAREVEERNADPLHEAKRPGGFFLRADGTPVDAEGREIPDGSLSADEKRAVSEAKKGSKEQATAQQEADKEAAKAEAEARKRADEAREAQDTANATADEARRANVVAQGKRAARR